MKKYFEYLDKNSSKFWEITLKASVISVRFGKLGTKGQIQEKKHVDASVAKKEYDKLIKEKMRKGYKEKDISIKDQLQSEKSHETANYQVLSFKEAKKKVKGLSVFQGDIDNVLYYEGNILINGNLDNDYVEKIIKKEKRPFDCIVVNGNLTVNGRIALYGERPGLFVSGFTKAKTLEGGDCEIYIQDGEIEYFVYGDYNNGILEACNIKTKFVINNDHDLRVSANNAIFINTYSDDGVEYDYFSEDISENFVNEVLNEDEELDIDSFLTQLEAGKNVLKPKAKSSREKTKDQIKDSSNKKGVSELDLSDKKLKNFPSEVFDIKTLKKLNLSDNPIDTIPAKIKSLENLEELFLRACEIKILPEEISQLEKLKVLDVSYNQRNVFTKKASSIQIPQSIGDLKRLEILNVSDNTIDFGLDKKTNKFLFSEFKLPDSIGNLENLKVLISNNNRTPLPDNISKLQRLEKVEMHGGSNVWLRNFPECLTKITSIKVLDLHSNPLDHIPESISNLKNLEELYLGGSLGYLERSIPDFSGLTQLKVLGFGGGDWGRTGAPWPPYTVLKQLLTMNLNSLEELSLSSWGGHKDVFGTEDRPDPKPDFLEGIGNFKGLRKIDLRFCSLSALPEEFYELKNLIEINLECNNLGKAEHEKITKAYPNAKIIF